ncbi:MAG TPA: hypothetical protein VHN59_10265 [Chitinophagaceae bacterium]|nr:hypothetical protein [Chitinophagaceae bacterium]
MTTPSTPDKRYFLNSLALQHSCDPLSLDPHWALRQLYHRSSAEEMQEMFTEFCEAAIAPTYNWQLDTPGTLPHFVDQLEQLIEACFLLLAWVNPESPAAKKNEVQAVRQFFKIRNLSGWKQWLHRWTISALSARSVAELVEPEDLLPFVQGMEKLLTAGAQLSKENKKRS